MAPVSVSPPEGDTTSPLVRADVVEAWAQNAFVAQAIPGYHWAVRRAVLCMSWDRRVFYAETSSNGLRLWRRTTWSGSLADLGAPGSAPKLFEQVQRARLHRSPGKASFVLKIAGTPRIVRFTGYTRETKVPGILAVPALLASLVIPEAGHVFEGVDAGVTKLRNRGATNLAVEAAETWRSVLEGRLDPAALPRLSIG